MAGEVSLGPLDTMRRMFGMPTLNEQMIAERKAAEEKAAAEAQAALQRAAQQAGAARPSTGEAIQQNRAGGTAFGQVMDEMEKQRLIQRYNAGLPGDYSALGLGVIQPRQ